MESKYKRGKIYKLTSGDLVYYGSTTQKWLCQRYAGHSFAFNHDTQNCKSKELFENGDVKITLVEDYPCERKEQLLARERYYIENNECVNKQIPGRTKAEYTEYTKDKTREYQKNYMRERRNRLKISSKYNNANEKKDKKTGEEVGHEECAATTICES